jgi:hypothetical protein
MALSGKSSEKAAHPRRVAALMEVGRKHAMLLLRRGASRRAVRPAPTTTVYDEAVCEVLIVVGGVGPGLRQAADDLSPYRLR